MKLEDIKSTGVMGGGITQTAIMAGYKTIVRDLTDELLEKTRNVIVDGRFGLQGGVTRDKQTQEQMD